jgi:hypothetical protein
MNSRLARYFAAGILVGIVVLAALQVSAVVWLAAIAVAVVAAGAIVASAPGPDAVEEAPSQATPGTGAMAAAVAPEAADTPATTVEVVRVADETRGTTTVWLHRSGGRRVHRFADGRGWTVQQVSTKDPDNPKKRIIGEPLSFTSEDEAVQGADNLARGILPRDVDAAREFGVPPVAMAEARRRNVRLTGQEQARRLASEWGVLASA